jgi:hypothetical protein
MMKSMRLLVVAILAFAGLSASPAQAISVDLQRQAVLNYWTPFALQTAVPMEYNFAPGANAATRFVGPSKMVIGAPNKPVVTPNAFVNNSSGSSWVDGGLALAATGKVFFSIGNARYVCSGSVVTEADTGRSVVLTAGHCIWDQSTRAFVTNFLFIPAYDTNPTSTCSATAYGCWTATALVVHNGWSSETTLNSRSLQYDWGFVAVNNGGLNNASQLDATVGSFPLDINGLSNGAQTFSFGYPAGAPYGGADLIYCSQNVGQDANMANLTWALSSCTMTGGSSGGPWMASFATDRGSLVSVNSYGYTGLVGMYGPKFNANTTATFNSAMTASGNTVVGGVTPPAAPVAAVTITGTAAIGQVLTADTSATTGSGVTFTFRWQRATTINGSYSNINRATARTYTIASGDASRFIRVVVTARNTTGTSTATSTPVGPVGAVAPTAVVNITGTPAEGNLLTATTTGTTGSTPLTWTYRWESAPTAQDSFTAIGGATASTYRLVAGDVGRVVRVVATATNSAGTSSATSNPTAAVTAAPLVARVSISGTARVGRVLTANTSTTTGSLPIGFTYQWLRASSTNGIYSAIPNATGATYTLTTADRNQFIRVQIVATNNSGSSTATSGATARVR